MVVKTDRELVQAYIQGKEEALKELLRRHKSKIYNYIYKKINDSDLAEDIFQEVFIKVIITLKEGRYNEEGKFLSWVLRISHNLVVDHFRVSGKNRMVSEFFGQDDNNLCNIFDFIKSAEQSIEDVIIKEQNDLDLKKIIELLPQDQKEILDLRFYKGLSFKEISEENNISINTALGRMRYALMNLRKLIINKNLCLYSY